MVGVGLWRSAGENGTCGWVANQPPGPPELQNYWVGNIRPAQTLLTRGLVLGQHRAGHRAGHSRRTGGGNRGERG